MKKIYPIHFNFCTACANELRVINHDKICTCTSVHSENYDGVTGCPNEGGEDYHTEYTVEDKKERLSELLLYFAKCVKESHGPAISKVVEYNKLETELGLNVRTKQ